MNRNDLFRYARQEVERRRQAAETKAEIQREEIYKAVPQLAALDSKKGIAGAEAARLATDGQRVEAEKKLLIVHQAAEEKRALLKKLKIREEDLQPKYFCEKCKDTGRFKGEVCQCVRDEVSRMRRKEINQAGPLVLCSFDTFSLERYPLKMPDSPVNPRREMELIYRDCRDYAQDFGKNSPSLFMFGTAGLGKSHLALSIASMVLEKGYDVIYVSAQSAFSAVSSQRFTGDELFISMLEADLLILDDLGTEFLDKYTLSRLYELINGRTTKPTIYTTNIFSQDILHQRYTEKIASRLMGGCHLMRFVGEDLRLQKNNTF